MPAFAWTSQAWMSSRRYSRAAGAAANMSACRWSPYAQQVIDDLLVSTEAVVGAAAGSRSVPVEAELHVISAAL